MENKPIITCHGDQGLFSKLHQSVVQGLPREQVDWRRSYGRTPRTVKTEASFVPFNPDILIGDEEWTLLGRPFFHTYWTDCDIDTYKSVVKDEIVEWLSVLKSKDSTDWMIIVVVYDENKVKTKLLRSSVFDKIKTDFCSKQPDR
ncbi:Trafficking protein particle complex subunit 10 [Lamellibrachia satsuma]|nr:Trafficking protein particle complex subunit 10 [Lamellibrachia satsuma]